MVEAQEFGFDKERFPDLTGENFDCIICSEVVRNPKECTECGSLFCAPCINSWMSKKKECPNRCALSQNGIKPIGKALLRMYNELDIKCIHYDKCGKIVKLTDLEKHETFCQLPKCNNFELCSNFVQNEQNRDCSPECGLINKLKNANNDWKLIYNELKEFLSPYSQALSPKVNQSSNSSQMSSSLFTPSLSNGPVSLTWDSNVCGTGITLTKNNTHAYLKESSYLFRSVLTEQYFTNGVHYWEIHADSRTENELKIGVSLKKNFDPNSAFCDSEFGYAYYGLGQLRHGSNANGNSYGKKFKKEGVLGVCLDMTKGTLSFALNGEFMGVAFQAPALKNGPIYPAVSLLHNAGCQIVSGKPVPKYF